MEKKEGFFMEGKFTDLFKMNEDFKDLEIKDESLALNYLSHLTDNIRENNKKLTRNSLSLIISFTIFILILNDIGVKDEINFMFIEIQNKDILISLIPIYFAFFYCKNIAIMTHTEVLKKSFDIMSQKAFKIGKYSKTSYFIKPFLFYDYLLTFVISNHKLSKYLRKPVKGAMFITVIAPLFFEIWTVVIILKDLKINFITCLSAIIVIILLIMTISQIVGFSLIHKEYEKNMEN